MLSRKTGRIDPLGAIDDETRTVDENDAFLNLGQFLDYGTRNFLRGYWRTCFKASRIISRSLPRSGRYTRF